MGTPPPALAGPATWQRPWMPFSACPWRGTCRQVEALRQDLAGRQQPRILPVSLGAGQDDVGILCWAAAAQQLPAGVPLHEHLWRGCQLLTAGS